MRCVRLTCFLSEATTDEEAEDIRRRLAEAVPDGVHFVSTAHHDVVTEARVQDWANRFAQIRRLLNQPDVPDTFAEPQEVNDGLR